MKGYPEYIRRTFGLDANKRPNIHPPKDKLVLVKYKGQQKVYRVNKYGELFELKQ